MKAGIVFTGTGPILILVTYKSFDDPNLIEKLAEKGILKFIAYELDEEQVRKKYGKKFEAILNDVKQEDDLRVLDYNGHNVFYNFPIADLGNPVVHE